MQAKKTWAVEDQPEIDVAVVVHTDGRVDLKGRELNVTMWNHDPGRLQDAMDEWSCGSALWRPRFHVLSVPGLFGLLFNLATLDTRTPCHAGARPAHGEAVSDFIQRAIREDHGFLVPGRHPALVHDHPIAQACP